MSLRAVSNIPNEEITVVDGRNIYTISKAARQRGEVKTTEDLRAKLKEGRLEKLAVSVYFYKAASGNEYIITGELPKAGKYPEDNDERTR